MMNFFKIDYDTFVQQKQDVKSETYHELVNCYSEEAVNAFLQHWEDEDLDHFEDAYCGQFDSIKEFVEDHLKCYGYVIPPGVAVDYDETWDNLSDDYIKIANCYFLRNF